MRRNDKEITDKKEILEILKKSKVCYLGLSNESEPYVVPMNFGYQDETIYLHCALAGKKVDLIKMNPTVCLAFTSDYELKLTGEPQTWTTKYRSVIVNGKAEILTNIEDKQLGINILLKQYSGQEYKIPEEFLDKVLVIKVEVMKMTGKANWY